jgi:hypothetical protein
MQFSASLLFIILKHMPLFNKKSAEHFLIHASEALVLPAKFDKSMPALTHRHLQTYSRTLHFEIYQISEAVPNK